MSETVDSYEGQVPPEVYRRRRIVALLALVIVLLVIIGLIRMIVGGGNNSNQASSTATSATTSAEPFSDFSERATESAKPSESADPSASADASETASAEPTESAEATPTETAEASPSQTPEATPSETPEATPTPSETPATVAACSAADIKVNLTADAASYAAGQLPALAVTVTNAGNNPCTITGGLNNVDINITSGPAQVYNYAQCHAVAGQDAELAVGVANTTSITWDRTMNVLGCGTTKTIPAGHFWATATVNGVPSQPVRIIVNG